MRATSILSVFAAALALSACNNRSDEAANGASDGAALDDSELIALNREDSLDEDELKDAGLAQSDDASGSGSNGIASGSTSSTSSGPDRSGSADTMIRGQSKAAPGGKASKLQRMDPIE